MFMQAVYTPPSMCDFLSDEKWGWSEVGSVDETVWDQLHNYIPPAGVTTPGKTTQPTPSASSKTKEAPQPARSPLQPSKASFIQILKETC